MKAKSLLTLLLIALLALIFFSINACNVSNKHKTKEQVKTDSVEVKKSDSTNSGKKDSSTVKTDESETETEVEFGKDTGTTVTIINGDTIKTTGTKPIKIKVKGKQSKKDSTGVSVAVNTKVNKSDSTNIKKETKATEISKNTKKIPFTAIIGFVVLAGLVIFLMWSKRRD